MILIIILLILIVVILSLVAWRLAVRLLEFDSLLRTIIDPMYQYQSELVKISNAEGILHDHPEVVAFHRANVEMLAKINAAIASIEEVQPRDLEPKGLPPQVE